MRRYFQESDSDNDISSPEKSAEAPQEDVFPSLYLKAFYSRTTFKLSDIDLAEKAFLELQEMVESYEHDDDLIKFPKLRSFFLQWKRSDRAHERIAMAFSLNDFFIRAVDHFVPTPEAWETHSQEGSESEDISLEFNSPRNDFALVRNTMLNKKLKAIADQLLPRRELELTSVDSVSTLKISMGANRAYFKLGNLRACIDQALHYMGQQLSHPRLFAESISFRIFPDEFSAHVKKWEEFRTIERFQKNGKIVIRHSLLSHEALEYQAKIPRNAQNFLMGSLQPEYPSAGKNVFQIPEEGELLIFLSLVMIFQLRDLKAEDMADGTIIDAETPLIPVPENEFFGKFDARFLEKIYACKLSEKALQKCVDFLLGLDEEALATWIQNFSGFDCPLRDREREEEESLLEPKVIESLEYPEWHQFSQLAFQKDVLFSPDQVRVFKENVVKMKTIASEFVKKQNPSILQWVRAFDSRWVSRFVIAKLVNKADENLRGKLFETPDSPEGVRNFNSLNKSVDKSGSIAGLPGDESSFPELKKEALSLYELNCCLTHLGFSLSLEEISQILELPKLAQAYQANYSQAVFESPAPNKETDDGKNKMRLTPTQADGE